MRDGSRRLIHEWDTGRRMEEEGCCCCRCCCRCGGDKEAGLPRQDALIQLLRQKETRQTRIAQFSGLVVLLLVSGTLALLAAVVLGGRGHPLPDRQLMMQPDSHSPGVRFKQQQPQEEDLKNPTAMLTAPTGNNINGDYLEWESVIGTVFCQGGFNYSKGSLVVPKTGHYRIFLQITYESKIGLQCDSDEDEHRLINKVLSYEDNYKKDVPLLSSVDSVNCSMKQWSKSLYTAGIYYLHADCKLRVTSSKPELITKEQSQVFFGAELLR